MLKFIKNKKSFLQSQKKEWDKTHNFWTNDIKRNEKSGEINRQIVKILRNFIKSYKKTTIIDAGCGHGWIYDSLSSTKGLNFDYYGIDYIDGFIKTNSEKNKNNKNAHFIEFDLASKNIPNNLKNFADIVLNHFNLVELWDIENAFKNMAKMLKDNGKLIVTTKDMTSVIASNSDNKKEFLKNFDEYVERKSKLCFKEEIVINGTNHTGKFFHDVAHSIGDYVNNAAKNNLYLVEIKEIMQRDVTEPQLGLIMIFEKLERK